MKMKEIEISSYIKTYPSYIFESLLKKYIYQIDKYMPPISYAIGTCLFIHLGNRETLEKIFRIVDSELENIGFDPNNETDPESISYSKHLSLINIIATIANNIDGILVFHYLGAANLAIYSFATAMPEQIKGWIKNLSTLAMPKFSEKSRDQIGQGILYKTAIFGLATALIVLLYVIVAPFIFSIFFPKYLASTAFSQVFAISLISTINLIPQTALQAQSAKQELYTLTIYSSVIQIIILVVMVYYFGLWGAIWARVITRFATLLISSTLLSSFINKAQLQNI